MCVCLNIHIWNKCHSISSFCQDMERFFFVFMFVYLDVGNEVLKDGFREGEREKER